MFGYFINIRPIIILLMILRAMLAVVQLLIGFPCQTGKKVVTQAKRNTLVLQVGGWV
jgi:hypothetical protein